MQADGDDRGGHQRHHAHRAQLEITQLHHGVAGTVADAVGLAPREGQHRVLKENQQTKGGKDLHVGFGRERLYHQPLDGHAQQPHRRRDHQHRQVGVDPELRVGHIGAVHAEHHEVALGEIDDAHDAEDEVQTDADQAIDPAQQQPVNQHGDDMFHGEEVGSVQKCRATLLIGRNTYHKYFPCLINVHSGVLCATHRYN